MNGFIRGLLESTDAHRPPCGVQIHAFHFFNQRFVLQTVGNQIGDGDQFQSPFIGNFAAIVEPRHGAVFVHDFDDDPCRFKSREPREINGSLGVACPAEHAAFLRSKWKNVPRLAEFLRSGARVDECLHRFASIGGTDARRATMADQVNRNGEWGFVGGGVLAYHEFQAQLIATILHERRTDEPPPMCRHEIDHLRRRIPRRSQEISLILPVLIIYHNDDLSLADGFNGLLDAVQHADKVTRRSIADLHLQHDFASSSLRGPCLENRGSGD